MLSIPGENNQIAMQLAVVCDVGYHQYRPFSYALGKGPYPWTRVASSSLDGYIIYKLASQVACMRDMYLLVPFGSPTPPTWASREYLAHNPNASLTFWVPVFDCQIDAQHLFLTALPVVP
jgi:hypothetical protein